MNRAQRTTRAISKCKTGTSTVARDAIRPRAPSPKYNDTRARRTNTEESSRDVSSSTGRDRSVLLDGSIFLPKLPARMRRVEGWWFEENAMVAMTTWTGRVSRHYTGDSLILFPLYLFSVRTYVFVRGRPHTTRCPGSYLVLASSLAR